MKTFAQLRLLLAAAALALLSFSAQAQLSIEITGAGASRFPVIIPVFENEASLPRSVSDIVRADLERSGLFSLVDIGPLPLPEGQIPDLGSLRSRGADAALAASVFPQGDGRYEIRFRLFDTQKQTELGALALRMTAAQNRITAHRIADFVYEKLTGLPGYFATRIAYVVKTGPRYELQVADADGMNAQAALVSREPIISPAWSPDGGRLAYVSFEAKKPIIYVHTLATGQRQVVANFKGSNSAPAWSPDGQQLSVVLTKDGLSQLYVLNADGSGVRRLASSSGIDTEPAWSPDGQWIYFTSDRGGSPQIYRIPTAGGAAQRVTFDGTYNVTARPSADGRLLAFITRNNGRFQVAVQDLTTRQTTILTDSARDESPSFAPNGRMILYATDAGGRGVLAAVSSDGRVKQRLSVQAADVREPAWGPLQKQ
ncbi:Tol-Pal system beta propeller repeat protein TolB [Azoarcus olearius]|uniref:Tol-Pal system protein TolB n=1 Tax=Azoarcus sp. (strain BH72) TaxID=418699 RepID=TOLB_AZOSB|nr:Tol-Pal system beta propeller repeat protein TolB [Azoarcus olearius]A1K2H9.1 RecName: Full=Tol-Pal system protein TolB; Flags: Precursor [Azoarcus olearius]ANQ83504.1 translocation protein TolB [Azoarcus olearius]CAL93034.1 putative translocation protein TolB [Azoarcus olearius]